MPHGEVRGRKRPLPGLASGDSGLVPRGSEGWRRGWVVSPQVLGRCSEATKMGPLAGLQPVKGEGVMDV